MNLQKKILNRYRQFFPNETLKETSERTGIQITRVFRLFNGKQMKVVELEAFENAIQDKLKQTPHYSRLTEVLEQAAAVLTNEELGKIISFIDRKLRARSYGRFYITGSQQGAYIA